MASLGKVAEHFGVSVHTVKKDWRPAWPEECGEARAWNLDAIARWRSLQQSRSPAAIPDDGESGDWEILRRKRQAEARIKEADAEKRERENRLAEESIVFRGDVEAFLADFFRLTRDLHQKLAEEMRPEFPAKVRQDLADSLTRRCAAVMRTLHTQAQRIAELADADS